MTKCCENPDTVIDTYHAYGRMHQVRCKGIIGTTLDGKPIRCGVTGKPFHTIRGAYVHYGMACVDQAERRSESIRAATAKRLGVTPGALEQSEAS